MSYFQIFFHDLKSNFFDLFSETQLSFIVLHKILFRLFNMENTVSNPAVAIDTSVASEESTTSYCCSCPCCSCSCDCCLYLCCKDKCAVALKVILAISIIMSIVACIMYTTFELTSPNLLCTDRFTSEMKFIDYVYGIMVAFLCMTAICCLGLCWCPCGGSCDGREDLCRCCSYNVMIIKVCYSLVFVLLLLSIVPLNFHGTNMIVQSSSNGTMYRCELDRENPDAHLLLFPSNGQPTSNPNQTCEFWPAYSLCEALFAPFYSLKQLVKVNGTKGAYRCSESSPEGRDVCVGFLRYTQAYSCIQTILAYASAILLLITCRWIEKRDQSDECARRCDCCSPENPRYQLISQDVAPASGDSFHDL
jgi:hypothetical protein